MIAFQTPEGHPIATLANFSMHYFGDKPISADYYGQFCDGLEKRMLADSPASSDNPPAVAIMSHGCSGDIWKKDYLQAVPKLIFPSASLRKGYWRLLPKPMRTLNSSPTPTWRCVKRRYRCGIAFPDAQRLQWAQQIVAEMGDRLPKTQHEIYAREQVYLHQMQSTEIVAQAIRIGEIAIASTPNETYALTGLKLKLQSPLEKTMVIELANGGDGYIPPPEQHYLGGYNTWAARSAGLEVTAEPRIVATDLQLLEQVCGKPRRAFSQSTGSAAQARLALKPLAYWRLDEMSPVSARCERGEPVGRIRTGRRLFSRRSRPVHAGRGAEPLRTHFAGGRLRATLPQLGDDFTVVMSFWNGMPVNAREVAGWMFSRDYEYTTSANGIHLGLAGATERPGCLLLQCGTARPALGKTAVPRWEWATTALVKQGRHLRVYLSGSQSPEIDLELPAGDASSVRIAALFFGWSQRQRFELGRPLGRDRHLRSAARPRADQLAPRKLAIAARRVKCKVIHQLCRCELTRLCHCQRESFGVS